MSTMESRFNLIDEPWIPVAGIGQVSLREIFENSHYRSLGGNPVQRIALLKLLLAIAQAAATPEDESQWRALDSAGLAKKCSEYLTQWHDRFYLYGERPFLQMPAVKSLIEKRTAKRLMAANTKAKELEAQATGAPKSFGAGFYPDLPSENNTQLSHSFMARELSDAEKAVFIVTLMNFAFGGKRVEADMLSLAGRQLGNRYTAASGPSLGGHVGQLHCFPITGNIIDDIWISLLTEKDIQRLQRWPVGSGRPIWESMPLNELDVIATTHKETYQATLVALSRFVLLERDGIYYLDGIQYHGIRDGWYEPSLLLNFSGSDVKVKYVDPEKRPWRELESLLSFIAEDGRSGFECFQVRHGIERLRSTHEHFAIWCGGLKVRANSGDQSVKQSDDFVESQVWLHSAMLGEQWFAQLKTEMDALSDLAKALYGRVLAFYKKQTVDGSKQAAQATNLFWQLCERQFQQLVDACDENEAAIASRRKLREIFASYVQQAYDQLCPKETARQLDAWAACRPNNRKYLYQEA